MKNTYILLVAGKGNNLEPLTLKYPKTSYLISKDNTVLQSLVSSIRRFDKDSEIVAVLGYQAEIVKEELEKYNVKFVYNPFYQVTGSISSLWFAKEYLERENVTILNGDLVFSEKLFEKVITKHTDIPYILVDSSFIDNKFYNVVTDKDRIMVMSKKLTKIDARYCGVVKLDPVSSRLLKKEVNDMVFSNMFDLYFEDALSQMIVFDNFSLFYSDVKGEEWTEINDVDDLLQAKKIIK